MIRRKLQHERSSIANRRPRTEIIRRWVETADERCPLACTWYALHEKHEEQDDDSWLSWPAFSRLCRKAGLLHSIHVFFAHSLT